VAGHITPKGLKMGDMEKGVLPKPSKSTQNVPIGKNAILRPKPTHPSYRSSWLNFMYFTRWKVEDTIRFIKQSYDSEDVRVLTYKRLKNMATLTLAASYFAAVWLGTRTKLKILAMHAMKAAKRIFGIPDFRYYALADGISVIFRRIGKGPLHPRDYKPVEPPQLSFW
jgi:hypothetical protein